MAESVVDPNLEFPFVPTFFHVALAKVSVPLFFKHGSDILNKVMTDIQQPEFNGNLQEITSLNYRRAQEALLFIPVHLRQKVVEAVNSIEVEVYRWQREHYFLECENTRFWERQTPFLFHILYWMSDGTIDRTKTSQELVMNKDISINMRFKLACKYCFKETIKTLWAEMVASGKTKNHKTSDDSIEKGWIEWIRAGTPDDWTHAILRQSGLKPLPRFSSFFSLLQPEDRTKVLIFMADGGYYVDDLRFCFYAMTNEEKVKVLKISALMFLRLFVRWPLQSYFLEMTERVKNYINCDYFLCILDSIMIAKRNEDFDYSKLIVGLWNIYPDYYKELLEDFPDFSQELHEFVNENRFPKILYTAPTNLSM